MRECIIEGCDRTARRKKYCGRHGKQAARYKMSEEQMIEALKTTHCEICKNKLSDTPHDKRQSCIDHCHETLVVRGVLCRACNLMIGFAEDDEQILLNAIKYLNK